MSKNEPARFWPLYISKSMALLIRLAIHFIRENVVSSGWLGHVRRAQKLDNYSAILKCIETQNGEKYFPKKHSEN
jgi:hypothetical protein